MKKILLLTIIAAALLIPVMAYADGTATYTPIVSNATDNTLNYKDTNNNTRETVNGTSLTITTSPEYGLDTAIGTPADQPTTPGVAVNYDYTLTNIGNASDTYALAVTNVDYQAGTGTLPSDWAAVVTNAGGATITDSGSINEDATFNFKVKVTPNTLEAKSSNGSYANVTVTASTSKLPVGAYVGANGNSYGGAASTTDTTKTTINMGVMTMTRTATVDAPGAYTGNQHDAVPGAIITYTITYSNIGSTDCKYVIIADKVPSKDTYTNAIHANGTKEGTVTITAAQGTATGWEIFQTTDGGPNVKDWNSSTGNWTMVGTLTAGTEKFTLNSNATYVKWQKPTVPTSDTNKTLTWGVVIK